MLNNKEILHSLNWRYSTKHFDVNKRISEQDWEVIEETLRLAPSSYGLQALKFIVITNPGLKKQLSQYSMMNTTQVESCSHLVVFCVPNELTKEHVHKHVNAVIKTTGTSAEKLDSYKAERLRFIEYLGKEGSYNHAVSQSFIALGNVLTVASLMKIDACPMGGFYANEYAKILKLDEEGLSATVICAFGYRDPNDKNLSYGKVRFSKEEVIKHIK